VNAVALYAKPQPGFEQRLHVSMQLLAQAAAAHAGAIVQASSLGAEDMCLTDLIARQALPIAVATLDTGALHDETLALMLRAEAHYGLRIERWAPAAEAVLHFVGHHGEQAMRQSVDLRKACCALRKLEPLDRMLQGRSAWVAGLRREQSQQRAEVVHIDSSDPARTKFNPLADWSWHDVWHYIQQHQVPYNALHDRFFPSIGCAPCTRAVALGEDPRAGRWWWEQASAKECGLHVKQQEEQLTA
jgi:phosphoadenosine phosphosulfate reductase